MWSIIPTVQKVHTVNKFRTISHFRVHSFVAGCHMHLFLRVKTMQLFQCFYESLFPSLYCNTCIYLEQMQIFCITWKKRSWSFQWSCIFFWIIYFLVIEWFLQENGFPFCWGTLYNRQILSKIRYIACSNKILITLISVLAGSQMILAMKVISLGFDLDQGSVASLPSVQEYFGYTFCVGTCIFGPWVSFNSYQEMLLPNPVASIWLRTSKTVMIHF